MSRSGSRNNNRQESSRIAPVKREASASELAEVHAFRERDRRRPAPPRFELDGERLAFEGEVDEAVSIARLGTAVGSADRYAMGLLANQVSRTVDNSSTANQYNVALALVSGIQPRNETEGMLAAQMVGCHNLAMAMLDRATRTERMDFLPIYGNLATKLLRTFAAQTEALARMRGQTGQQTVRVEHVTVEPGGQAVVGAVTTGGYRGCEEKRSNDPMHRERAGG